MTVGQRPPSAPRTDVFIKLNDASNLANLTPPFDHVLRLRRSKLGRSPRALQEYTVWERTGGVLR